MGKRIIRINPFLAWKVDVVRKDFEEFANRNNLARRTISQSTAADLLLGTAKEINFVGRNGKRIRFKFEMY